MDILDDSNGEILTYFSKFKDNENYSNLLEQFSALTKFRVKRMIELEKMMIPDIGPSEKLHDFPSELKNWPERDIAEVKTVIKLYDSGEIESLEEAIILIEIIKNRKDNYPKILDTITEDLNSNELKNIEFYDELIRLKESNYDDSIIYGSLWSYLAILLADVCK